MAKKITKTFMRDYCYSFLIKFGSLKDLNKQNPTAYKLLGSWKLKENYKNSTLSYAYNLLEDKICNDGVYLDGELRYELNKFLIKYKSLSQLQVLDKTLFNKVSKVATDNDLDFEELLSYEKDNNDRFMDTYLTVTSLPKDNRKYNETIYLLSSYINMQLSVELKNLIIDYYNRNKNFLTLEGNNHQVYNAVYDLLDKYISNMKFINNNKYDAIINNNVLYGYPLIDKNLLNPKTEEDMIEKRKQMLYIVQDFLCIIIGCIPRNVLSSMILNMIISYNSNFGNLRYLYDRNPAIYKIVQNYAFSSGYESIADLLKDEGFEYKHMEYADIDYVKGMKGLIEVRLPSVEKRVVPINMRRTNIDELIYMDRKVFGFLYKDNLLETLRIKYKIREVNNEKMKIPSVYLTMKTNDGYKEVDFSIMYLGVDQRVYLDGNPLNISSTNMIKQTIVMNNEPTPSNKNGVLNKRYSEMNTQDMNKMFNMFKDMKK